MIRMWRQIAIVLLWLICLTGCSLREGAWPPAAEPMVNPERFSPQTVGTAILWRVSLPEASSDWIYEFRLSDGTQEISVQKDKTAEWRWIPDKTGKYRVKAVVVDSAGHRLEGAWSREYEIVPALALVELTPDKPSPQQAGRDAIGWQAKTAGGVAPLTYEFIRLHEGRELTEQQGESPTWQWRPVASGEYRIGVKVRDAAGNTVGGSAAAPYEIQAPLVNAPLVAVLPPQNMSGMKVPVKKIQERLENMGRQQGMKLVDEQVMQDFISRHRLRFTAGIDGALARALREETGAEAVLFSVIELYREDTVPKLSMTVWLDRCDDPPPILWMASKSLAGDEAPGLLDLGMVRQVDQLLDKLLASLFKSWGPTLLPAPANQKAAEVAQNGPQGGGRKFQPQEYFRSESYSPARRYTVAVLPFYNLSERKYAGELMELQFVNQLRQVPNLTVIEPGELRQYLLRYRIIMEDGLSLANAEVLFAKLGVDLLVTGKVFDYEDYGGMIGKPIVDFSAEIFSKEGNRTLWTSKSYTDGEKGVYFFDFGKVYTAHNLAGQMVGAIARKLEE